MIEFEECFEECSECARIFRLLLEQFSERQGGLFGASFSSVVAGLGDQQIGVIGVLFEEFAKTSAAEAGGPDEECGEAALFGVIDIGLFGVDEQIEPLDAVFKAELNGHEPCEPAVCDGELFGVGVFRGLTGEFKEGFEAGFGCNGAVKFEEHLGFLEAGTFSVAGVTGVDGGKAGDGGFWLSSFECGFGNEHEDIFAGGFGAEESFPVCGGALELLD